MPRCSDGSWCIDDLCHITSRTLCGVDTLMEYDEDGEFVWAEYGDDEGGEGPQ